ncbi:MAG: dodecin family protein [Alphaproteobacteria bacterium]|mgnify:CR=1 FL=1|nr:dodecin family protein [Alphaproteobacteria bacterium]
MAIMKSEQILTESPISFEDAIQTAVTRFSKTVRGLRSANVNNMSAMIANGAITSYRVNLQITFEVEDVGGTGVGMQAGMDAPRKKKKKKG